MCLQGDKGSVTIGQMPVQCLVVSPTRNLSAGIRRKPREMRCCPFEHACMLSLRESGYAVYVVARGGRSEQITHGVLGLSFVTSARVPLEPRRGEGCAARLVDHEECGARRGCPSTPSCARTGCSHRGCTRRRRMRVGAQRKSTNGGRWVGARHRHERKRQRGWGGGRASQPQDSLKTRGGSSVLRGS